MRNVMTGILAALLCLSATIAAAEEWPSVLKEAQDKCQAQHALIHDMTLVQAITSTTPSGTMNSKQTLYERGEFSRMEMTMPSAPDDTTTVKMIVISNSKEAYMFSPFTGKRKLPESETRQHNVDTECWDFTPANSTIIGSGTAQGKDCYLVALNKDSVQHKLWLEKTGLNVLEGISYSGPDSVRWVLSDFRPVIGDYQHPHKVEMFDGSELISTMTVESIQVNSGLKDDLFDPEKVEYTQVDMEKLLQQMMQAMPDTIGGDSTGPAPK